MDKWVQTKTAASINPALTLRNYEGLQLSDSLLLPRRNRFMYGVYNQHIFPPFLAPDDGLFILYHASCKVVHLQLSAGTPDQI